MKRAFFHNSAVELCVQCKAALTLKAEFGTPQNVPYSRHSKQCLLELDMWHFGTVNIVLGNF